METFAEAARRRHVRTLAVFGDSITEGAGASAGDRSWAWLLAHELDVRLINQGIGGTVLQSTPIRDGRGNSGVSRFRRDLLDTGRADCLAILYGYNDARYTGDPDHFNAGSFARDYRVMLDALLAAGFGSDAICMGSPPYPPDDALQRGSPGFTGQSRTGFEDFVRVTRGLATEFGLFYAAVYESMADAPDGTMASADRVHPNDAGHRVIAAAFAAAHRPMNTVPPSTLVG